MNLVLFGEEPITPHIGPDFERDFWIPYAKARGKKEAINQWNKLSIADREAACAGVAAYVHSTPDKKFRKDPERYLKKRTWEDEIIEEERESQDLSDGEYKEGVVVALADRIARRQARNSINNDQPGPG
jgi:hypothetical protein